MPEKALASIAGLPLLEHVRRRAVAAEVGPVVVATCDPAIAQMVEHYGGTAILTGAHGNGTLRVAEAAQGFDADVVLNVQGDQPLLDPEAVRRLAHWVVEHDSVATVATPWPQDVDLNDAARVKVWSDRRGFATDFSRSPLAPGARLHVGLYGFPRDQLRRVTTTAVGGRARVEGLEQLTWLEAGLPIFVGEVPEAATAVDTLEQLARVRAVLGG